jgi:hypothetical protein
MEKHLIVLVRTVETPDQVEQRCTVKGTTLRIFIGAGTALDTETAQRCRGAGAQTDNPQDCEGFMTGFDLGDAHSGADRWVSPLRTNVSLLVKDECSTCNWRIT